MISRSVFCAALLSSAVAVAQDIVVSSTNSPYIVTATTTANSITLQSGGTLQIDGAATVAQTITVVAGSSLVINSGAALDNLNVASPVSGTLIVNTALTWDSAALTVNGRLTLNAKLTVNGNLSMGAGSFMDHAAGDPDFDLAVSGVADLQGLVDVNGRGLAGYQAVNVNIPAAGWRSGGSHGGRGGYGAPNQTYGDSLNPTLLGAAGGEEDPGRPGGRGGGKVSITAGTLRLGGGIVANGATSAWNWGGGGAGGSVLLRATTLEGAGGVQARGASVPYSAGGGGGRIAIYATTNNWTGTASAPGGSGNWGWGSIGSVVIGNSALPPAISVGGGYFRIDAAASYPSITMLSGGELHIDGAATVTQPITVTAGSTVYLNSTSALDNLNLTPSIFGTLVVNVATTWDSGALTVNGRLTLNNALTVNGNVTMGPNSVMDHSAGDPDFHLSVTGTADLGGLVDVSGRGLAGYQAVNVNIPAAGWRSGGSHGGRGGYSSPNQSYGDPLNPTMLGAAGGEEDNGRPGGTGGGKVSITAGTLRLGGGITANGVASGWNWGGGGAGGSVLLRATTLEGTGGVQARGASAPYSGGGGGGRIAIYATTSTWTGTTSAAGGSGPWGSGSIGSVVVGNSASPPALTLGGGYFRLDAAANYPSITLLSGGELHIDGAATVTQPITVAPGSIVYLNSSSALNNLNLNSSIAGTLVINAPTTWDASSLTVTGRLTINEALTVNGDLTAGPNSFIDHWAGDDDFQLTVSGTADLAGLVDVSGRGLAGYQAVNVNIPAAGWRSGGSHGGRGGYSSPTQTYGDALNPNTLGAAGGEEDNGRPGGNGGGKVFITAGTLRLGGGIVANGVASGWNWGGGGAGGTVLLRATTLEGSGGIQARGGSAPYSAGGGGGRIAVYATNNSWLGTASASGGSGPWGAGGLGTVVIGDGASPPAIAIGGGHFRVNGASTYPSIRLLSGGELHVDGAATVTAPITIASGSTIHLNSSSALNNLDINSSIAGTLAVHAPVVWDSSSMTVSGTLVLNDKLTVNGDLTLTTPGLITHDAADPGFELVVTGLADLVGVVDVSGRGLAGYQAINALIGPAGWRSGGSHGGRGGYNSPNALYGDQLQPALLGAAGGEEDNGRPGGTGGGKVSITAGTLRIGGGIRANGVASGWNWGGAGAGGSVLLRAMTLEGGGSVLARGGSAPYSAGGGGGRIAIYAGSSSWTGVTSATGGTGPWGGGGLGSVYISDLATPPAVAVGGGYYRPAPSSTFESITLLPGGELYVDNAISVTRPITVSSGAFVFLNHSSALSAATIGTVAGLLEVNAPILSSSTLSVSGTLLVKAPFTVTDLSVSGTARIDRTLTATNVSVQPGGVLTHSAGVDKMVIDASGTVALSPGSKIDLNGMGLATNETLDPLTLLPTSGAGTGVGGSHGGLGGSNGSVAARSSYGSQYQPVSLGAGASSNGAIVGGRGGGRLKLTADSLVLGGQILANGANPGGAGGSVWIVTNALSGGGVVEARGGNSQNGAGGGVTAGGGGRIAIEHASGAFTGLITALPGSPYSTAVAAGLGSAWLRKGTGGGLTVMNGSHVLTDGESFSSLSLTGTSSQLVLAGKALVSSPVSVPVGASVVVEDDNGLEGVVLADTIAGSLIVNAASALTGARTVSGRLTVNAPFSAGELSLTGTSVTTIDARLSTTGDVLVASGATIRHSPMDRDFDLRVGRKLVLQTGATIDARGLGLRGGYQGAFGCRGTALDATTYAEIAGSQQFAGGSYGALGGGSSNPVYASATNVEWPGAGGGCGVAATDVGGNGGGILRVQAQLFELYGVVDASGSNTATQAGAGAGGGVHIIATELRGNGVVRANGGNSNTGNGGGGGRILLEVSANTFSGATTSSGGTSTTQPQAASSTPNTVNTTPVPVIVSTPRTVTAINAPYSYDADGLPEAVGVSSVTWQLPTAPAGATINSSTGAISWTPSAVGVYAFVLRASSVGGTGDQSFMVEVRSPPVVTSTAKGSANINAPYSYGPNDSLVVTGSAPMTFVATIAPSGNPPLAVDNAGKVTWTPTAVGTHAACIRVTNAVGSYDHCFTVNVSPGANAPDITSTPLTTSSIGASYTYQPAVTGTAPIAFAFFQNTAPPSATIDAATGLVTYTPAAIGKDSFCISATNSAGSDVQCWQVTVGGAPAAPQIVSSCNPLATVSRAYHYDADDKVEAVGTQPITFALASGPNGMTVSADGLVTWAPDLAGGASFTIRAQNPVGQTTQTCSVGVQTVDGAGPAVVIRDANLKAAVGIPYRYSFDGKLHASGDRPITFSKVAGPQSLNVDSLTGAVSWTPAGSGNVDVTVRATNAAGSDTYVFTISVVDSPPTPPVASFTMTPSTGDAPLTVQLDSSSSTAAGGVLSMSFALGDGSPDKQGPTVSHTYQACAGYLVRLRVTDLYGQVSVADKPVAVTCAGQTPPSAKILAVVIEKPGETSVAFSCDCKKGSGDIVAYQWSATDGMFSDQSSGTHLFQPGMHALRLAVIDSNGLTAVDSIPVYASTLDGKKPPTVVATAEPSVAKAPATVKLSAEAIDPDGQVVQVKWKFSDGAVTTERNPVRNYANPIAEKATVEVTDNDGLTATAVVEISITGADNSLPPTFLSRPVEDVFAGQAYSYDKDGLPTVKGKAPFTYELTRAPEGATVDPANGKISWAAPFGNVGPHEFSLKVNSAAGSATQDWRVTVVDLGGGPPADPQVQQNCGCNGLSGAAPFLLLAVAALLRRRRPRGEPRTGRPGALILDRSRR